jgi:hypothetical protein
MHVSVDVPYIPIPTCSPTDTTLLAPPKPSSGHSRNQSISIPSSHQLQRKNSAPAWMTETTKQTQRQAQRTLPHRSLSFQLPPKSLRDIPENKETVLFDDGFLLSTVFTKRYDAVFINSGVANQRVAWYKRGIVLVTLFCMVVGSWSTAMYSHKIAKSRQMFLTKRSEVSYSRNLARVSWIDPSKVQIEEPQSQHLVYVPENPNHVIQTNFHNTHLEMDPSQQLAVLVNVSLPLGISNLS